MSKKSIILVGAIVIGLALAAPYWLSEHGLRDLTTDVRKGLPGKSVKIGDSITYYEWTGPEEGPVVVLVHGGTRSSYVWDHNVDALAKAGFRVLRYDHLGRGYSDRPAEVYGVDLFDRQLVGLLDTLGVKGPVDLVGLSQGGAISVVFTARHPKRVRKLALLAPAGFPLKLPPAAKLAVVPGLGDWVMAVFGRNILMGGAAKGIKDPKHAKEITSKLKEQLEYRGYMSALLSMLRNYPLHGLEEVYVQAGKHKIPTLVIWGEQDKTAPVANANKVQAAIPHATLAIVPGVGHAALYEDAEKVNPILIDFLKE